MGSLLVVAVVVVMKHSQNGAVTSKAEAVNTQSDFFSDFIEFLR
ncbi:hypothetical protein OK016_24735 [Vibrio chagasii]|nr:hypothetical protein [Vibrio chagasii]